MLSQSKRDIVASLAVGMFLLSFVCDTIYLAAGRAPMWSQAAVLSIAAGMIGIGVASLMDYVGNRSWPGQAMLFLMTLSTVNLWLRSQKSSDAILPLALSIAGLILMATTRWLGEERAAGRRNALAPSGQGLPQHNFRLR